MANWLKRLWFGPDRPDEKDDPPLENPHDHPSDRLISLKKRRSDYYDKQEIHRKRVT